LLEYKNEMLASFEEFEHDEKSMTGFELGQLDNRVVKLKKYDSLTSYTVDYTLTFASVF
jgi:hypothetical protein